MNKKMQMILGGAAVGAALLLAAPTAGADPTTTPTPGPSNNSWGQAVAGCNASDCYSLPNGTTFPSRGGYVSTVVQDPSVGYPGSSGPGYAGTLHNLGSPGNSNPSNLGGPKH
jgi:hypothetical protein